MAPAGASGRTGGGSNTLAVWIALGALVVIAAALVPGAARALRRRKRYAAARHGDIDALWQELSDTTTDLGYAWSAARSPRQVSAWLARDAGPTAPALDTLAAAVEHRRYAATEVTSDDADRLVRALHDVDRELRSRRSRRLRLRAALWPASLGWGRRWGRPVARLLPQPRHT